MFGKPRHVPAHKRHRRRSARWWLPFSLAALVVTTMSAAEAHWTGSGSTTGSGATGTTQPLVITPGAAAPGLRPGGRADVSLLITNPTADAVHLTSITVDPTHGAAGLSVDPAHASCDTSALGVAGRTTGWTVPGRTASGDGSLAVVLTDVISMTMDADNACQGANFVVHLQGTS